MSFFEVEPEVLRQQGSVISGESNTLSAVAARIRMVGASSAATGFADAAQALNRFAVTVSSRVDLMRQAVDGIGFATGKSGATYTVVDRDIATDMSNLGEQLAGAGD
jgi:hypothetical protein